MKRVLKYQMDSISGTSIQMPRGARILELQDQFGTICAWALCDQDEPLELRKFYWVGTGQFVDSDEDAYVGTIQRFEGRLVLHLFEDVSGGREVLSHE